MKRLMSKVKRTKEGEERSTSTATNGVSAGPLIPPEGDSPEAIVIREAIAFCESAAPGSNSAGEEYLHLPAIVDGAESSPSAAKEAAVTIRRYLSKEHYPRGFAQYNAIMLMRILTDNPGRNFTQNVDKEFVSTVKRLLRDSPDQGVQQILRETLDYFEVEKSPNNATLGPLMEMWRKEKGLGAQLYTRNNTGRGVMVPGGDGVPASGRRSRGLPPPDELAARIEEAKTTARLLLQTMQSTPSNELLSNDLVREFAARARAAQKSVQNYMHAENPAPDDDTMLTLIETNEQLNIAMSKHHRAMLTSRRQNSHGSPSPQPQPGTNNNLAGANAYAQATAQSKPNGFGQTQQQEGFVPPPGPPPSQQQAYTSGSTDAADNPFTDAAEYEQEAEKKKPSFSLFGRSKNNPPTRTTEQPSQGYVPQAMIPSSEPSTVSGETQSSNRPTGYGFGQGPTQSYLNRQESATNHLTMHGASPPLQPQTK